MMSTGITDSRTQGPGGGCFGADAPQNTLKNPEHGAAPMAVVIGIHDKSESNGNQSQFDYDDGKEQTASSRDLGAQATTMLEQLVIHSVDSASQKQVEKPQDDEICVLCMDPILHLHELPCGHRFCAGCLGYSFEQQYEPRCPTCGLLSGVIQGNQPVGMMLIYFHPKSLPGYEAYRTLVLEYSFQSGTQNDKHPNPGRRYHGTYKKAYLPYSPEGKEVYELLRQAFDARLTFTVGQSTTNGLEDQVIWSDIPHKTKFTGEYGYPDPGYLARVKQILKEKGIVPGGNNFCNLL